MKKLGSALYILVLLNICTVKVSFGLEKIATAEGALLVQRRGVTDNISSVGAGGRDPFNWTMESLEKLRKSDGVEKIDFFASLVLSAIIWDQNMPMTVINGRLLEVGDTVNGNIVKEISRNEVVLEQQNEQHTLRFNKLFELEERGVPPEKRVGLE